MMRTFFRTSACLAVVCGFVSLAASMPASAKPSTETDGGTGVLSERVAALVMPKSKHDAPAEGSAAPAPKPSSDKPSKKKAGSKKKKRGKKKKRPKAAAKSDGSGGRKTVLEDDFLVEGQLEKPNAYYILRRSQAGYDWARLDAKFLPLVLESVQDPLF